MRVAIVSIGLAGGMLALGACGTVEPGNLTLAERAQICGGRTHFDVTPTGRHTGDVRQDYRCGGRHGRNEANVTGHGAARSAAIDRSQQGRRN